MDNERIDDIVRRLGFLERRLDSLADRLERLEARRAFPDQGMQVPVPPPVQPRTRAVDRIGWAYPGDQMSLAPSAARVATGETTPTLQPKKDAEYMIGAQILPKAGAVMMLLGLTFLVVLAYSRGWITPAMMFGIEVLFCGGFVVLGTLKRDMKEEFGQILTGIGSCGWYLVFAGGHLYYHLYSGEVLVGLFFVLSLANLAFSFLRSSRAFLAIGLIGGLVTASVLPNLESDHSVLNAWIHFLILIPAALITARNRWRDVATWLWVAATLALLPIFFGDLTWVSRVGVLYASSAICLAAFCWSSPAEEASPWETFPPVLLWITGLIGLGLEHSPESAWQFAGFFAVFGGVAWAFRDRHAMFKTLALCTLGVPLTLAPMCFPVDQTVGIYASLSILCAAAAWWLYPKAASIMAITEFLLGSWFYLQLTDGSLPWRTEAFLLVLLSVAVSSGGKALVKGYGEAENVTVAAMVVCIPFMSRLGVLLLGRPNVGWGPPIVLDAVMVAFTYYALALYIRTRWMLAFAAFWAVFSLALALYIGAVALLSVPLDAGLLLTLMAAPVLSLTVTPDNARSAAKSWTGVIVGLLFTRLVVVMAESYLPGSGVEATIIAAMAYSAGCFGWLWRDRKQEPAYAGWVLLSVAGIAYMAEWDFPLDLNLALVSGLLLCLVFAGRATARIVRARAELATTLGILGWAVFSRWSALLFAYAIPSLESSPALSIGWTAYFFGLMALGFTYRVPQFRYVSLAVLATTLAKIVLIDLSTTDAMIRVAVTIVASLVMLAVGYWYVHTSDTTIRSAREV